MSGHNPLRYGIIGCGNIAGRHAQVVRELEGADLSAVCDLQRERAQDFADRFQATPLDDAEALFSRDDVDAVLLTVPPSLHAELGIRALQAGKHVLTEKPIDLDPVAARELVQEARRRRLTLSVISQHRFHDDVQWMRRALLSGLLGRTILVDVFSLWKRDQAYYEKAPGRGLHDPSEGGVLLNQAVHAVDLLLWTCGAAEDVSSRMETLTHRIAVEDTAIVQAKLTNQILATLVTTTSIHPQEPERFEIRCEHGTITLAGGRVARLDIEEGINLTPPPSMRGPGSEAADRLEPFRRQHRDFLHAIRSHEPPTVRGEEAISVLEFILAAHQSHEQKERVFLNLSREFASA